MENLIIIQKHPKIKKNINDIQIPDLWHIAMNVESKEKREKILEVWHLCHSLKDHIKNAK